MKMILVVFTLLSMSLTALAAKPAMTEAQKEAAIEASNYGLCHELKLRPAQGDEVLIEVNCANIIESYELKIEKTSLQKRIRAIDAKLKKLEASRSMVD